MSSPEDLISAVRGEIEVDLLLEGAMHIYEDVAIYGECVAGFDCSSAKETLDLDSMIPSPGFVDGHQILGWNHKR